MAKLRISPDQMRDRASAFNNHATTLEGVIADMDRLLQSLQEEWEGEASSSFAARYQELKPNFIKTKELIAEIASTLSGVASSSEQFDSEMASHIR